MNVTRQNRVNKGLCPDCGKEAAPYYLCIECRQLAMIGRNLRRMESVGATQSQRDPKNRRRKVHQLGHSPDRVKDLRTLRAPLWEGRWDDKRLRPRIGKIPVEVEAEIVRLLEAAGKSCTEQELIEAWGRMRFRASRESAAKDCVAIIEAQRRREARAQKRRGTR